MIKLNRFPKWSLAVLTIVCIWAVMLPGVAEGQSLPVIADSDRRVILVPGITFTRDFDPDANQGRVNACARAIETFPIIHKLLTNGEARKAPPHNWPLIWESMPQYKREHIYAFDYSIQSSPNEPCGRYNGDNIGEPLPKDANNNEYTGTDTRTRITDSIPEEERRRWWQVPWNPFDPGPIYAPEGELLGTATRFGKQISAWRKECPSCHFDIIAHSLGGAVVAYWLGAFATDDDKRHTHSFITIDSPVNGIDRLLVDGYPFSIRAFEDLKYAGGLVPLDLKDPAFIAAMRRAPYEVDMRCISNLYDALIPPQAATIRHSSKTLFYGQLRDDVHTAPDYVLSNNLLLGGPCDNLVGSFSIANPYGSDINFLTLSIDEIKQSWANLRKSIAPSHSQPTSDPMAVRLVMHQLARDTEQWKAINNFLNAWLERPLRSRIIAPATETTAEIVLRNTGSAVWKPGEVRLEFLGGNNFELARSQTLTSVIKPNEVITLTLKFRAPAERGTYPSRWRLARGTTYFGPEVIFGLVVLPPGELDPEQGLANPLTVLQAILDKFVTDTQDRVQEEIDKLIAELRRQAIREFWRAVCGVVPAIVILSAGAVTVRRQRWRRLPKEGEHE